MANNNDQGKPLQANEDAPIQTRYSLVESWVFSTASCYHVTPDREIMENYTSGNYGKVYGFGGGSSDVVGKGDVRIKVSDNVTWILRDVKHIPGGAWNQLSVQQLCQNGYDVIISPAGVEVSKGDFVFTVPHEENPPPRVSVLMTSPF